jgi:hypothetical protein
MVTLEIYMKSGNVLVLDNVKDWKSENRGDALTRLEVSWKNPRRQLLVATIALSSVEAICVRTPWWRRLLGSK